MAGGKSTKGAAETTKQRIKQLLLLAVGTKLEHVIDQLAHVVAEKHIAIEGDLVVQPSDDHFWVIIQVLCSYSTLPLYAIVTQMGTCYKKAIFEEHVQEGLVGWAQNARKKGLSAAAKGSSKDGSSSTPEIQLGKLGKKNSVMEEGNVGGIEPSLNSDRPK
ncbi:hypothetical protein HHK36_021964 [Tetracentron sinense]|uniref:Uncharacterized protein n=1 Tax=Tetracentron sinense TaxID=13715 RepID=A0A834YP62_TETSI|nr:hypothetical protein HHK36_021964 [Tetracentron sinense]